LTQIYDGTITDASTSAKRRARLSPIEQKPPKGRQCVAFLRFRRANQMTTKKQHKKASRTLPQIMAEISDNKARLIYHCFLAVAQGQMENVLSRSYLLTVLGRHGNDKTLRCILDELERLELVEIRAGQATVLMPEKMRRVLEAEQPK
jgi:hypothetical protein